MPIPIAPSIMKPSRTMQAIIAAAVKITSKTFNIAIVVLFIISLSVVLNSLFN